jgi:hypothetical protein
MTTWMPIKFSTVQEIATNGSEKDFVTFLEMYGHYGTNGYGAERIYNDDGERERNAAHHRWLEKILKEVDKKTRMKPEKP